MHPVHGADQKLENVELCMVLGKIGERSILEFLQGPFQVGQMKFQFLSCDVFVFSGVDPFEEFRPAEVRRSSRSRTVNSRLAGKCFRPSFPI